MRNPLIIEKIGSKVWCIASQVPFEVPDGCINDGWLLIGDIETVFHQDFLYYILSSSAIYNILSSLAVGSTTKNLKSDSIKSLIVLIPPLKEQKLIADHIETLLAITT